LLGAGGDVVRGEYSARIEAVSMTDMWLVAVCGSKMMSPGWCDVDGEIFMSDVHAPTFVRASLVLMLCDNTMMSFMEGCVGVSSEEFDSGECQSNRSLESEQADNY
jgi:hypothetical protein